MSVSKGAYKRLHEYEIDKKKESFLKTSAYEMMMMAPAPLLMKTGAIAATFAIDKTLDYMNYEEEAVEDFGKFINATSYKNIKGLNKQESLETAEFVRDLANEGEVRATVGNASDVEDVVKQGVSQGVFLNTGSVSEFKQRSEELVKNYREIQHIMQTTSEEAIAGIGSLMSSGMASSIAEVKGLVGSASTYGSMSGFSSKEMLQIAEEGSEMVRGSGISMNAAAKDMMETTARIRMQMGSEGSFGGSIIEEMGGSQNAAINLQRIGNQFGGSSQGKLFQLALQGDYEVGDSMYDMFSSAQSELYGLSPAELVQKQIEVKEASRNTDASTWATRESFMQLTAAKNAYGIDELDQKTAVQLFENMGISTYDAEIKAADIFSDPGSKKVLAVQKIEDEIQSMKDERPTGLELAWGNTTGFVREKYTSVFGAKIERPDVHVKTKEEIAHKLTSTYDDPLEVRKMLGSDILENYNKSKDFTLSKEEREYAKNRMEDDQLKLGAMKEGLIEANRFTGKVSNQEERKDLDEMRQKTIKAISNEANKNDSSSGSVWRLDGFEKKGLDKETSGILQLDNEDIALIATDSDGGRDRLEEAVQKIDSYVEKNKDTLSDLDIKSLEGKKESMVVALEGSKDYIKQEKEEKAKVSNQEEIKEGGLTPEEHEEIIENLDQKREDTLKKINKNAKKIDTTWNTN